MKGPGWGPWHVPWRRSTKLGCAGAAGAASLPRGLGARAPPHLPAPQFNHSFRPARQCTSSTTRTLLGFPGVLGSLTRAAPRGPSSRPRCPRGLPRRGAPAALPAPAPLFLGPLGLLLPGRREHGSGWCRPRRDCPTPFPAGGFPGQMGSSCHFSPQRSLCIYLTPKVEAQAGEQPLREREKQAPRAHPGPETMT